MEYYQLLAGLAIGRLNDDDGSGPPPAVPGHELDRRASRRADAPSGTELAAAKRRRRGRFRGRTRGATPATVT
ncbi:hypothetical protein [Streptomyces hainanensis]|uniref:Uncharacterized protein n=1 Tax=Streptomyces hainanensis TaxID=402648 RepID=A0A4R4T4N8_9ACTN|nr:hypothetical protein [Streptomyces hainanensis]TDC71958.1 hypothetical protein E1283_22840 [Streptomyces hainanensis]